MHWYAYRLPNSREIHKGSSECIMPGIVPGGFAISPFKQDEYPTFTIPQESEDVDWIPVNSTNFPAKSTSPFQHSLEINTILTEIEAGEISKCIAATVRIQFGEYNLNLAFERLCLKYPRAFIFAFSSPLCGTWIGASPELLLKYNGSDIFTMSLAGTKPADDPTPWDIKNRNEQRLVTEFIKETFESQGILPDIGELSELEAGPVKHLCTRIRGKLNDWDGAVELALHLSPTPALSGLPRENAIRIIDSTEKFRRSYYGGFCGPTCEGNSAEKVNSCGFEFYVNLRSALAESKKIAIFAGGGIVAGSKATLEWEETRIKGSTIASIISEQP